MNMINTLKTTALFAIATAATLWTELRFNQVAILQEEPALEVLAGIFGLASAAFGLGMIAGFGAAACLVITEAIKGFVRYLKTGHLTEEGGVQ